MEKEKNLEKLKTLGKNTARVALAALVQNLPCIVREFLDCLYGLVYCVTENINDTARLVHSSLFGNVARNL